MIYMNSLTSDLRSLFTIKIITYLFYQREIVFYNLSSILGDFISFNSYPTPQCLQDLVCVITSDMNLLGNPKRR